VSFYSAPLINRADPTGTPPPPFRPPLFDLSETSSPVTICRLRLSFRLELFPLFSACCLRPRMVSERRLVGPFPTSLLVPHCRSSLSLTRKYQAITRSEKQLTSSNIIPPLINILQNADFKTKKEACWALSNATSGGLQEPNQIRYLVSQGCIKPMCDLLQSMDNKIIQVSLDGLENILKVGEIDKEAAGAGGVNQYAQFVEEAGGMVSIHNLQHHENLEIYKKCFYIMDSKSPAF
jgi:hypothetical protein